MLFPLFIQPDSNLFLLLCCVGTDACQLGHSLGPTREAVAMALPKNVVEPFMRGGTDAAVSVAPILTGTAASLGTVTRRR